MDANLKALQDLIDRESAFVEPLTAAIGQVIVGQRAMIERILIALLADGHILLEGVPGLAKTRTVKTVADCITGAFSRIQFTPDLLPADLTGTMIYNQQSGQFSVRHGPIFANLVLADEINRAPAKVQSALLEAMQEHRVTIGDRTYDLPQPFVVMATQNPVEQEGTYALPEAQVDRFMLMVRVTYPTRDEERVILERMTAETEPRAGKVIDLSHILNARRAAAHIYMDAKLKDYILDLVFATREPARFGMPNLKGMIEYGASPRAGIFLAKAARAHAFLKRRGFVMPEDVKAIGPDVLRHRVIPTYEAEAENISSDTIVKQIFDRVEIP
ncbi:MAG: hypothetical protein GMKNLPBB_02204 [Myxococcota bacterium]|nr:hypothetical protein [Myxococcota bacterium]